MVSSSGTPGEPEDERDFQHQRHSTFEITLTPALSRSTRRGGKAAITKIRRQTLIPLPRHRLPKRPLPSIVPLPFDDKSPGRMHEPITLLKSVHTKHFSEGHSRVAVGHRQMGISPSQYVAQFHVAPFAPRQTALTIRYVSRFCKNWLAGFLPLIFRCIAW